jgi:hypothetical protein
VIASVALDYELERLDVVLRDSQDRLFAAEDHDPTVFAFNLNVVEGFANDLVVVSQDHAIPGHGLSPHSRLRLLSLIPLFAPRVAVVVVAPHLPEAGLIVIEHAKPGDVLVRTPEELYYRGEIEGPQTTVVYTRAAPPTSRRGPGHLSMMDVSAALLPDATAYVCGSAGFTNAASELLVDSGVPTQNIRVERFGPTGPTAH